MTPPSKPAPEAPSGSSEAGFDARLERLERIVGDLEGGELSLEGSLKLYREGVELLQRCRVDLQGYRKQVEELSAQAEAALEPYADDPDVEAP
jgi:exodeoxyribonuclease VII small subunit